MIRTPKECQKRRPTVRHYIADQEAHHAKSSYVDELKELLGKAGIPYEEKYLL